MVKLTKYELKLIAKNRGINNYLNMSEEKLLSTLDKLEGITENLSKYGLNKIVKMQNLSLNELEQVVEKNNFSENKLKQIVKIRHIKNYKHMSKEDFLIALLKSPKSHAELENSEDNNTEIEETKKIFNKLINNFSRKKLHIIRKKFYQKKRFPEYLKELNEEGTLTEQRKKEIVITLKQTEKYFKKLKEDLNKLKKYPYNITEDIKNLFNEISEDYYKPIKIMMKKVMRDIFLK